MTTRKEIYEAFAAVLRQAGHSANVVGMTSMMAEGSHDMVVDGTYLGSRFRVSEQRASGTWSRQPTGKWHATIRLGSYATSDSKAHSFPQRGDGTFDVARALPLLEAAMRQNAEEERATRVKAANRGQAVALHQELGMDTLGMRNPFRVCESADPARPVQVTLDVTLDMTAQDARRLFQALQLHGVPVHRAKE